MTTPVPVVVSSAFPTDMMRIYRIQAHDHPQALSERCARSHHKTFDWITRTMERVVVLMEYVLTKRNRKPICFADDFSELHRHLPSTAPVL